MDTLVNRLFHIEIVAIRWAPSLDKLNYVYHFLERGAAARHT